MVDEAAFFTEVQAITAHHQPIIIDAGQYHSSRTPVTLNSLWVILLRDKTFVSSAEKLAIGVLLAPKTPKMQTITPPPTKHQQEGQSLHHLRLNALQALLLAINVDRKGTGVRVAQIRIANPHLPL